MTTMGKTLFVILGLTALFGATLALRTERDEPVKSVQLTPAQVAELQTPPAPEPPKVTPPAPAPEEPAQAPDLDVEDGSGS